MSKTELDKVKQIALRVREWAEVVRENTPQSDSYGWYDDLCGMCAICSYELARRLKRAGFYPRVHVNESHSFVRVNKVIVDVTATQFGYRERVLIRSKSPGDWWNDGRSFRFGDKRGMKRAFRGWPKEQKPLLDKR